MKSIAACEYRVSARARFRSKNCAPNASKGFLSEIQDPGTGVGTTTRYQRDAVGRITATTHCPVTPASLPAGLALSAITGPDSASTLQQQRNFNADTQSNRLLGHTTTDTTDGATTSNTSYTYQYNAAGQLTNTGATGLALAYDTAGRLGQLAPAAAPAQATRYQHNLLGQRVRKIDASQNTITLYGEAEQGMESMALGLYNSTTGTGATEVIYLPTASGPMPLVALVKGTKYAIHSDHLNTPRRLIQSDGKVAWQWVTTAFGEVLPTTGKTRFISPKVNPATTGTTGNTTLTAFDLRYPGQVEDTESGLFYNHNRFYDPVTGRYLQADPIGLEGGWNRFGYVGENPLSFIDPEGLQIYNGQTPPSSIPGGPWVPQPGQQPGTFQGPKNPNYGGRDMCRYVPDEANGGPKGAKKSYWKTKEPGKPWTRFDLSGNPVTPEQAHPGNSQNSRPTPLLIPGSIPLYPLFCPLCNVMFPTPNGMN